MAVVRLRDYVKRYTQLNYAIDALTRKKLVLPNPSRWDDLNDQEFVELYRQHSSAKSVYALCCTMSAERYHHWKIFADGSAGVCIEFEREPLQAALNKVRNVRAEPVKYLKLAELEAPSAYHRKDLPFIKRLGYADEREWRILLTSNQRQKQLNEIPFEPASVHRIILNPWMSSEQAAEARKKIRPLVGAEISITRSYLTNSEKWKALGQSLTD